VSQYRETLFWRAIRRLAKVQKANSAVQKYHYPECTEELLQVLVITLVLEES